MRVQEKPAEIGIAPARHRPGRRDRMAEARQVHANLMRSAGADADFEIAEAIERFEQTVFRDGFAARGKFRGHADAADRIARDGRSNPAVGLGLAVHQRQIDFLHLPRLELRGERMMRAIGARDDERAAGFAIEAMDDAGAQISVHRR